MLITRTNKTHTLRVFQPSVDLPKVDFKTKNQKEKIYTTPEEHLIQGLTMDRYNPNLFNGVSANSLFPDLNKKFSIEVKGYGEKDKDGRKRLVIVLKGRDDIKKLKTREIPSVEIVNFSEKTGILDIYFYGNSSGKLFLLTVFPTGDYAVVVLDEFKPRFGLVTCEPDEPAIARIPNLVQREMF